MPNVCRILLIESDNDLSSELVTAVENEGYKPQIAKSCSQAAVLLRSLPSDVIVSEVRLPDGDVEQIYRDSLPFLRSTPVIFTSSSADIDQAVRLVKNGAVDYLQKPYDISVLISRLRQIASGHLSLKDKSKRLDPTLDPTIVSPAMLELRKRLERLAASTVSALIVGDTGSGKEIIARRIHHLSAHANEPFVVLRCGSLAGEDGERLLFGEVLRSSNGAGESRAGAFERAGQGTLFLDEISELPSALRGKLIRVIDSRRFMRAGDLGTELPFEARILASSHLHAAKLRERLTPDLVNRVAVIEITVPPLRERRADIEPLVRALLSDAASELGVPALPIEAEALAAMSAHDWPGNVRELRNRLLCGLNFAEARTIGIADVFPEELPKKSHPSIRTLNSVLADAERQRIADALRAHRGRVGRAAQSLGISRVTLWAKMKRLNIAPQTFSAPEPRSKVEFEGLAAALSPHTGIDKPTL